MESKEAYNNLGSLVDQDADDIHTIGFWERIELEQLIFEEKQIRRGYFKQACKFSIIPGYTLSRALSHPHINSKVVNLGYKADTVGEICKILFYLRCLSVI
ncbi:MAG: hypothetical protein QF632_03420 [Candidatus Woesearchaeota archaeon]|jgi:hypothetical protein|nr:hypothetical protein [Candidatus Woesearchaeota archaeon]MDP7323783.1 hypothetical protein [Candidatus Woesearchaeota archaeon]MDP7457309.1 hypothetical protein [Candidatus Woesearchaeota archaeon]|tara:strand:- start:528 stop:830 length:303 start_codon:yes stop_codon:yes gene_type:complete